MAEYSAALKKGYTPSAMFTTACRMRRRRARREMGDIFVCLFVCLAREFLFLVVV